MGNKTGLKIASYSKRFVAFGIDWYLSNVFMNLSLSFIYFLVNGKFEVITELSKFPGIYSYLAGFFAIVFGILYYFVIPAFFWDGQTLGKKLMGLKIVNEDFSKVNSSSLAIRQILCVCILEGAFLRSGQCIYEMVTMLISPLIATIISYLMVIAFIINVAMISKKQRALHDLLSKTAVVDIKEK